MFTAGDSSQNLRQTGTKFGGQIVKGASAFVRTPSTIPSKFETVLHKDTRESKGFGSTAFRFDSDAAVRIPMVFSVAHIK